MPAAPLYIPVTNAPEMFSISRATIYGAAKKGQITIHKVGNRALLKVPEVSEWIESIEYP